MATGAQRRRPEHHKSTETHRTFVILSAQVLRMKVLTDRSVFYFEIHI